MVSAQCSGACEARAGFGTGGDAAEPVALRQATAAARCGRAHYARAEIQQVSASCLAWLLDSLRRASGVAGMLQSLWPFGRHCQPSAARGGQAIMHSPEYSRQACICWPGNLPVRQGHPHDQRQCQWVPMTFRRHAYASLPGHAQPCPADYALPNMVHMLQPS